MKPCCFLLMVLVSGGVTEAAAQVASPAFDIVSIHENKTATDGHTHVYQHLESGEYRAVNISLKDLMEYAFDLPERQVLDAPGWADSVHFDIDGKGSPELNEELKALPSAESKKRKQAMVRTMLVERFGLKAHEETRELPVYALVVAKGGVKFAESKGNGRDIGAGVGSTRGHINDKGCEVSILADQLAQAAGRPVVDRTGMTGRYDFLVEWQPDSAAQTEESLPPFFTAVQEQLGLKLEASKGPVPVVVVEHAAMPSAN